MPQERAEWVTKLLSWHGHDRGGVRVPFQDAEDRPIPTTIETSLVLRLNALADAIAAGERSVPRYIFLVGGPGNGKSEVIQSFLVRLDKSLGLNDELVAVLRQEFSPAPLLRRQVEIFPDMLAARQERFRTAVGRLVVIQDASATDTAFGQAARELVSTIADVLTTSEDPPPVFLVCVNRGIFAHALRNAFYEWGPNSEVAVLLGDLIRASSLGLEALAPDASRPSCWPLDSHATVACWPMDFESLLEPGDNRPSAFEQMLRATLLDDTWLSPLTCTQCASQNYCPFRQNLLWLTDDQYRSSLHDILRRGELSSGQRWNFRDLFSLVAEIMIGDWSDFGSNHPCEWVHAHADILASAVTNRDLKASGAYQLVRHLYPQALFSTPITNDASETCAQYASQSNHRVSYEIAMTVGESLPNVSRHIRKLLEKNYSPLDPAEHTPEDFEHPIAQIEEAYSQSVAQGNESLGALGFPVSILESTLLQLMADAENEWNILTRAWARTGIVLRFLRKTACMVAKRSIGTRWGFHAGDRYLKEYQDAIVNQASLTKVAPFLAPLFGGDKFRLDLLESFGQPQTDGEGRVVLVAKRPGLRPFKAPAGTDKVPRHDVPYFEVRDLDVRIPITFDLYLALRLRQEGCAGSSLPASVRAAIDSVRHRYAGRACRDYTSFSYQESRIEIAGYGSVGLEDESASPTFQPFSE